LCSLFSLYNNWLGFFFIPFPLGFYVTCPLICILTRSDLRLPLVVLWQSSSILKPNSFLYCETHYCFCRLIFYPSLRSPSFYKHTLHPQECTISPTRADNISRPRQLQRTHATRARNPHIYFIYRLPVELLSHVFVLGSEDDPNFPITVSHVSRNWRYIALHTPSLWRRITLNSKEYMWLERIQRARECSLDIQLLPWTTVQSGIVRPQTLNPYTVQWYMCIVLPYLRRWRSLEIVFSEYTPYLWKAALASCAAPAIMLQDLSLVYRLNDDTQEFLLFSGFAPRLRRVTVDGIRLAWLPSLFANLTFLDYTHHGFTSSHQAVDDVLSILTVSCCLIELRLFFPRGKTPCLPPRHDYVTKCITLPSLTHIQLTVDGYDIPFELAHLVTLLFTPSLSHLRLIDLNRTSHSFPSLKSFFYVYALPRTIRVIQIGHGWYDPRMIRPMTQSLPQLSKIYVKRSSLPDQVLNVNDRMTRLQNHQRAPNQTFVQTSHRQYRIDPLLNVQHLSGL